MQTQEPADNKKTARKLVALWNAIGAPPPSVQPSSDIDYWRYRILTVLLICGLVMGGIALIPAMAMAIRSELWGLAIFDSLSYLGLVGLLFLKFIPIKIRTTITLVIIYAIGVFVLIKMGPLSGGSIYLFTFSAMSGVLLGLRAAVTTLVINALTLVALSWLNLIGYLDLPEPLFPSNDRALVALLSFVFLNALAAISMALMTRGLQRYIRQEADTSRQLIDEIESRKQAEVSLIESEAKYRLLAENVTDVIWSMDMNLRFTYFSPSVKQVLGYTPAEAQRMTLEALLTPGSRDASVKIFNQELERQGKGQKNSDDAVMLEIDLITKDGLTVTVEIQTNFLFGVDGLPEAVIGVARDVTKRKQAEIALQESEEKFRQTFLSSPDAININRLGDGLYADINDGFTQITGFTREDVIGKTSAEIDIWDDLADRHKLVRGLLEKGFYENLEAQFRKKDGTLTTALMSARIINLKGERHIISITRDIGERKRTEAELQRLMAAIEQAGEMVIITDSKGIVQYVNPAFEHKTGYTRQEALGKCPHLLNSDQHDQAYYRNLWETITAGNRWTGQLVNRSKDGTLYTTDCAISPVTNRAGAIVDFVWIAHDISKELELENRVAQAQKMEAIGSLAGGIAHDFNNLLFPIMGMAEMLMDDLSQGSHQHENVTEIYTAAKRASDLVKQILVFSRQTEHKKIPIRIQQILREVLKLGRATIPSNIAIIDQIESRCGLVLADATQIHQIIMNLLTNAYHAVEDSGGTITVGVHETIVDKQNTLNNPLVPGPYVRLLISDTGCGIDPALREKIFEPYFTTKKQGKGTGLGLSVVYGIVQDHQGDIRVHSEVDHGTTFEIFLPVLQKSGNKEKTHDIIPEPTGHEQILLVDDEASIVKLETKMLQRLGYRVTARNSSVDALGAFRANPRKFDLVITDMTMPNMTGEQLAGELFAIRPDIPIIIATGFSETMGHEKAAAKGIQGFLMKPMVKAELAQMVRSVLDNSKPDRSPPVLPNRIGILGLK